MTNYSDYHNHLSKIADIYHSLALLQWDQEIYMPSGGAHRRAQQIATLSGMAHELSTKKEFGRLIKTLLEVENEPEKRKNLEISAYDFEMATKLPNSFVTKISETTSKCYQDWIAARKEKNFKAFENSLEKLVNLKLEESELLGYTEHPYDAHLNQYERGATVSQLDHLFEGVKKKLTPFVQNIFSKKPHNDNCFRQFFGSNDQWNFGMDLLKGMGYDLNHGRQDISTHPFTTNFSSQDVRVTTRIDENNLAEMVWSTIHEGGHALYEQGIKDSNYGLPAGSYTSLGIHESQSRIWENNVGRSKAFWKHNFKLAQQSFPQLKTTPLEDFYKGMNVVCPSPIRTNADELTYHFHVMIRYDIEKQLFSKQIKVCDLPEIWNQAYKTYLGLEISDPNEGILQDIHWSHGSFGYFPTYSIGSFYAAQFYQQACKDIPNLENEIAMGNNLPLLQWLRTKIHIHGKLKTADELCREITGESLNFDCFMTYAKEKYGRLYEI